MSSLENKLLNAALSYGALGWHVIPLWGIDNRGYCACGKTDCDSPGKHPIGALAPNGLKNATSEPSVVRQWWGQFPNANIGVATGAVSGIFALDVDIRKGGKVSLENLESEHGKLSGPVEQITGSGGRHILFKYPGSRVPNSTDKVGSGLDVRGDGGYIVVPPSKHISSGTYSWGISPNEATPASAPAWLLDLLLNPKDATAGECHAVKTFRFNPLIHQEVVIAKTALESLRKARANDYQTWIEIGLILKSVDPGPAMLDLWIEWSRQSAKFQHGVCENKWTTFSPDGRLTLATLVRWAQEDTGGNFKVDAEPVRTINENSKRTATILPYQQFPVDALPDPVRSFVRAVSLTFGCDPSFIALPALAALATVIGNTRRIMLRRSWKEPSVLWVVIIGYSGTLKSPAIEICLRPLQRLQREATEKFEEEQHRHEIEEAKYVADFAAWKGSKKRRETEDPPKAPTEPAMIRFLVSDITVEALAEVLAFSRRGVLLARDEQAAWFNSFDKYRGGRGADCQAFLEMHRAGFLLVDRKSGLKKTIQVERAAVSISGGIQPGTLRRALRPEFFENGLVARLLLTMPPRRPKRWTEKDIDAEVEEKYDSLFDGLRALDFDAQGNPIDLPLTPAAQRVFIGFYNELAQRQAAAPERLAAVLAKLEGYAVRFALVIHLVRVEANDQTLEDNDAVDEASVGAGITLANWFAYEAERIYGALAESDEEQDLRLLIELIDRKGGRISPSELRQSSRRFRDSSEEAEKGLQDLVDRRYGQWEEKQPGLKGGRPTRIFVLDKMSRLGNPAADGCDGEFSRLDTIDNGESDTEEIAL